MILFACPTGCCFAGCVMDIDTTRLILHAIDEAEAKGIYARTPGPKDKWATDYPFEGDLVAVDGFLRTTEQHGEQRPFGYNQVSRADLGLAIGGVGFKGPPQGVSKLATA
jgi:hypothetical protein